MKLQEKLQKAIENLMFIVLNRFVICQYRLSLSGSMKLNQGHSQIIQLEYICFSPWR